MTYTSVCSTHLPPLHKHPLTLTMHPEQMADHISFPYIGCRGRTCFLPHPLEFVLFTSPLRICQEFRWFHRSSLGFFPFYHPLPFHLLSPKVPSFHRPTNGLLPLYHLLPLDSQNVFITSIPGFLYFSTTFLWIFQAPHLYVWKINAICQMNTNPSLKPLNTKPLVKHSFLF